MRRVSSTPQHWPGAFLAGTIVLLGGVAGALAQDRPTDDSGGLYSLDWSLGLRGSYSSSTTTGSSYEAIVAPALSLTRNGASDQTTLSTNGAFAVDAAGNVRTDDLHAAAMSELRLDTFTTLNGSVDLDLTQLRPDDSSLPANTLIGPLEFTGTAEGSATRNLGHFDVTGRLKGERFTEGPTTLDTLAVVDNTDQNYWLGEAGLRVGYELTPLLSVFVDGSEDYQKFDAPSPSLLKFLDAKTATLRAGLSYTKDTTFTAEASVGRAWIDYTDATLIDRPAWVYDASVSFKPDETLTLEGALETSVGPSDTAGDTDVDYTLTGSARYEVNPWLTLRSSASADRTVTLGTGDVDWGYSAGAGLDFSTSRHVVWSADYLFKHDDPATGSDSDKHTVTLGVTLKR